MKKKYNFSVKVYCCNCRNLLNKTFFHFIIQQEIMVYSSFRMQCRSRDHMVIPSTFFIVTETVYFCTYVISDGIGGGGYQYCAGQKGTLIVNEWNDVAKLVHTALNINVKSKAFAYWIHTLMRYNFQINKISIFVSHECELSINAIAYIYFLSNVLLQLAK